VGNDEAFIPFGGTGSVVPSLNASNLDLVRNLKYEH
jgi:hypothetical protein